MERNTAKWACVRCVLECLVGFVGEIHIVPTDPAVVAADDEVVAAGVDGHGGDPLGGAQQLLGQLLLAEVVDAHVALRGHEEEGLAGVEQHALHHAAALAEGGVRGLLGQPVDQHGAGAGLGGHGREVVAPVVPRQRLDALGGRQQQPHHRQLRRLGLSCGARGGHGGQQVAHEFDQLGLVLGIVHCTHGHSHRRYAINTQPLVSMHP